MVLRTDIICGMQTEDDVADRGIGKGASTAAVRADMSRDCSLRSE